MYSIIILNKDKYELISSCLSSLVTHLDPKNYEILVGDTGSKDQKVHELYRFYESQFPQNFRAIQLSGYHFSKNNNEVARQARGDYFLFLNNDTVALDASLDRMWEFLRKNSEIGILGAKLLFGHNYRIQHFGIELIDHPIFGPVGFHPYANRHSEMKFSKKSYDVPAVTGACLLISKIDFIFVDGFDESYEAESQDVDLCFKVRTKCHKKIVVGGAFQMIHLENGSRKLGEENLHDRRFFYKRWNAEVSRILQCGEQTQKLEGHRQKQVLILREKARGDVLSTLRLVQAVRDKFGDVCVTFKTEYPDLIDNSSEVDRVLHTNDFDNTKYDVVLRPTYEDGTWRENNNKWLEQMLAICHLPVTSITQTLEFVPSLHESWVWSHVQKQLGRPYVVISTAAGWVEKEWTLESWSQCVEYFNSKNIDVVQVGGPKDPLIEKAIPLLDQTTYVNIQIFKNSMGSILLDSFPLHLAINTKVPILLLCCKTCELTTWSTKNVFFVRNQWAKVTPYNFCKSFGCRLKSGEGLDNFCRSPIIKTLDFNNLIPLIEDKFEGLNDSKHN